MSLTVEDKQWISQLLSEQLGQNRQWTSDRLEQNRQGTLDQLEKLESKLLTAFHGWSGPTAVRIRCHSAELRALQIDLETLQDRVDKLEENQSFRCAHSA